MDYKKFIKSILFWLAILASVYGVLVTYWGVNHVSGLVGMFVPVGPLALYLLISIGGINFVLIILIVLLGYFLIDIWLRKRNFGYVKSILIILIILFLSTLITDWFRDMPFYSVHQFINGQSDDLHLFQ